MRVKPVMQQNPMKLQEDKRDKNVCKKYYELEQFSHRTGGEK
jgi:hypothetical protein